MAPQAAAPGTTVHTALCRHEMSQFLQAAQGQEPVLVACTQEEALFTSAADHADPPSEDHPAVSRKLTKRSGA